MFEIRIHGRGGQGVVTAAELLSVAAFEEGRHAQAFPTFGSERMGAPVTSFCRIDDKPIRRREPVTHPDALVVQDPTLLHQIAVFEGFKEDGYLLVNTSRSFAELGIEEVTAGLQHACAVPATDLAREHLGKPLANAALLGGLAALTGIVSIESVEAAIRGRFAGDTAVGNAAAARAAYDAVRGVVHA